MHYIPSPKVGCVKARCLGLLGDIGLNGLCCQQMVMQTFADVHVSQVQSKQTCLSLIANCLGKHTLTLDICDLLRLPAY